MKNSLVGQDVLIHCYKHDGKPHRTWSRFKILEETERHFIGINNNTLVTESDGRSWVTKEPAICYFPKDRWYNVICMIRSDGIYYYCNIASPFLIEDDTVKYIDYDLDLRVFPDGSYKVLDCGEYNYHKNLMGYSKELDIILKDELSNLIDEAKNKRLAFQLGTVERYYDVYKEVKNSYIK